MRKHKHKDTVYTSYTFYTTYTLRSVLTDVGLRLWFEELEVDEDTKA